MYVCSIKRIFVRSYCRVTLIKSLSFCIKLNSRFSQTIRPSYLSHVITATTVSRPILTDPALWLQKYSDQRAHDFAHSPGLWQLPMIAKFLCLILEILWHYSFVTKVQIYVKILFLCFRKHRAAPNYVFRRSKALGTCKIFFSIMYFFTSWMAFKRLFNILPSMSETEDRQHQWLTVIEWEL